MQERDAPRAPNVPPHHELPHQEPPPTSRSWFRDRPAPEVTTARLVQWVDENGSVVRLISTDSTTTSKGHEPHDR
jgi:hypothetical protein